jgi:thiamine monophosphate synthase
MRAAEVLAAGPAGVAVMGGVMRAVDPRQEMKALLAMVCAMSALPPKADIG